VNTERPDHDDAAAAQAAQAAGEASGRPETPEPAGTPPAPAPQYAADGAPGARTDTDGEAGRGRSGRGRSPLAAASVAAAVLLVGGGGAYLATDASGDTGDRTAATAPGGGHRTPPPLVLDGLRAPGTGDNGNGDGSGGAANGIAPGEPNPYGTPYRAAGPLPTGPGSAPVYVPRGEVTRAQVARLARALGVTGTPVADARSWQAGTGKDGAGPVLRVTRQAPGAWTFSRYAPGTDDCKGVLCAHDPAAPAAHPVSVAAAEKAAAPVLKALGQDGAEVDAGQVMGAQRVVEADPRVGGLPTYGWTTTLTIGVRGEVVGGSGQLAAPVKADTYPVLSARRTLDLMNAAPRTDHRMGIGGCTLPVAPQDRLEQPCGAAASPAAPRAAATIDSAVFGLAAHSSGGRPALVPSWLFQVRAPAGQKAFTVTYPAVDPRYLTSAGTPSGQPSPPSSGTSGPGSGPTVTRDVRVTGYRAAGDDLTVSFEGGVCADYTASAKEGPDRVTVTVTQTSQRDRVCILVAKEYQRTVHLDHPLDGRTVVGSDGHRIPPAAGAGLPRSSGAVR
jgi:hypothetical protein